MVDKHGIDWDEVKDLMRPYKEEDEEAPYEPEARFERYEHGRRDWDDKLEEEHRLHSWDKKRKPKQFNRGTTREEKGGALQWLRDFRNIRPMVLMRNYLPYALLLWAAPYIGESVMLVGMKKPVSSWAILLCVAGLLFLLWLWLHPVGDKFLFRFTALSLPLEVYFMLIGSGNVAIPVVLLILVAVVVAFYHFANSGVARPQKLMEDSDGPLNAEMVEAAIEKKNRKQFGPGRKTDKAHSRKVLHFGVLWAAIVFLIPAGMGVLGDRANTGGDDISESSTTLTTAAAHVETLPAKFSIELVMHDIAQLAPDRWGDLTRDQKEIAMQALLDAETDNQTLQHLELDDKEVYNLKSDKYPSVKQAMASGKNELEKRIQAVSYAAIRKKMLSMASDVDLNTYETKVETYVEGRCAHYTTLIELHWSSYSEFIE